MSAAHRRPRSTATRGAAGCLEVAEGSLPIGGRAQPHALHAAAAAAAATGWPTVLAATSPGGTITFNRRVERLRIDRWTRS